MIDVALLLILGIVTWTVSAEGAWGAVSIFLSVVFSGLVAMDYFEPVAGLLESMLGADWASRTDFIALVGLFAAGVFALRLLSEWLVPNFIAVHARVYDACRWGFGLMTGYVTMAFLLAALHTAPLPRDFLGFTPERNNLLGLRAPDREWLGFVQYASEKSLRSSESGRVFDGTRLRLPGHDNSVWPTYIIRYASRRSQSGSAVSTINPTTAPSAAPSGPRPPAMQGAL